MALGKRKEVFSYSEGVLSDIEHEIQREITPALSLQAHDEYEDEIILKFSYTYDNIIKKDDELELRYIKLREVFDIGVDITEEKGEKKLIIQYPKRENVINNFLKKRRSYIKTMEDILAEEGSLRFIQIPGIRENLNPIKEIFNLLELEGSLKKNEWDTWNNKKERAELYLNLLNDYKFIKFEDNEIIKGEKWKIIDDREFDNVEYVEVDKIMSQFFKETYDLLSTKRYNLTFIKPYLDIGNACYYTSVIDEEISKQDSKSIKDIYDNLFTDNKTLSKIRTYLMDLSDYGIVNRDGSYFYPVEDIFNGFQTQQSRLSSFVQ